MMEGYKFMCVILASPDGTQLDVEELEAAQWSNPDGVGVAWRRDDGLVAFRKFAEFDKDKWRQPPGACVIHFRLATAGGKSIDMAHPFPISRSAGVRRYGAARRVLFHNGHISDWYSEAAELLPNRLFRSGPPWSDSRLLAYCVHRFGEYKLHDFTSGMGQRVAVFDVDNLNTYGDWDHTMNDGILRSNTYHLGISSGTYTHWSDQWDEVESWGAANHNRAKDIRTSACSPGLGYYPKKADPVEKHKPEPETATECYSLNPDHVESLCLDCHRVICPLCWGGYGPCYGHHLITLVPEPDKERYAG
jgi:hypothetical protein